MHQAPTHGLKLYDRAITDSEAWPTVVQLKTKIVGGVALDGKMTKFTSWKKGDKNNLTIVSKPHVNLQFRNKTSATFQKDRNNTWRAVALTKCSLIAFHEKDPTASTLCLATIYYPIWIRISIRLYYCSKLSPLQKYHGEFNESLAPLLFRVFK